jgi:hypothetical protein
MYSRYHAPAKTQEIFFAILQIIFVDDFSNERFILQVGTLLEQRIL